MSFEPDLQPDLQLVTQQAISEIPTISGPSQPPQLPELVLPGPLWSTTNGALDLRATTDHNSTSVSSALSSNRNVLAVRNANQDFVTPLALHRSQLASEEYLSYHRIRLTVELSFLTFSHGILRQRGRTSRAHLDDPSPSLAPTSGADLSQTMGFVRGIASPEGDILSLED